MLPLLWRSRVRDTNKTRLVYGGAGTITRMKRQMRREIAKENKSDESS